MSFRNQFMWSLSRQRTFDTCLRKFYLKHYGFWNGWRSDAPRLARLCYRITKMDSLAGWTGKIVHQVAEQMVREKRSRDVADYEHAGIQLLRQGWRESQEGFWEEDPKNHVNILEMYYGQDIPRQRTDRMRSRVLQCIRNFYDSEEFQKILSAKIKTLEEFQRVRITGFPVVLKMDLAIKDGTGQVTVYDWKSGKVRSADRTQMAVYALYAIEQWGTNPTVLLHYLESDHTERVVVDEEGFERTAVLIREKATGMAGRLVDRDIERNEARIEDFPKTPDRNKCLRCECFEACYGTREIPESVEALEAIA